MCALSCWWLLRFVICFTLTLTKQTRKCKHDFWVHCLKSTVKFYGFFSGHQRWVVFCRVQCYIMMSVWKIFISKHKVLVHYRDNHSHWDEILFFFLLLLPSVKSKKSISQIMETATLKDTKSLKMTWYQRCFVPTHNEAKVIKLRKDKNFKKYHIILIIQQIFNHCYNIFFTTVGN